MAEQDTSYDAIVRTEIAIRILNQARAIVTARVYDLEVRDPAGTARLRDRKRDLLDLQERLSPTDPTLVEDVIAVWGPAGWRRRPLLAGVPIMAEEAIGLLSPEKNESIFRNDILRDYLPDATGKAERPRLILPGGQPGAGKTVVLTASHSELARSGPTTRIVGDDLRSYHPQFLDFQRQDFETASRFTQPDAGRWTEKLLAVATERRVNVVFETTMRTPENVARVTRTARDAGNDIANVTDSWLDAAGMRKVHVRAVNDVAQGCVTATADTGRFRDGNCWE